MKVDLLGEAPAFNELDVAEWFRSGEKGWRCHDTGFKTPCLGNVKFHSCSDKTKAAWKEKIAAWAADCEEGIDYEMAIEEIDRVLA